MGDTLHIVSFPVVKSNPSGNIVRFTITDASNLLTKTKMMRAVLMDALDQFITAESADLSTNGDGEIETNFDKNPGDSTRTIDKLTFDVSGKIAELALTALTNIASTGTITATSPFLTN